MARPSGSHGIERKRDHVVPGEICDFHWLSLGVSGAEQRQSEPKKLTDGTVKTSRALVCLGRSAAGVLVSSSCQRYALLCWSDSM